MYGFLRIARSVAIVGLDRREFIRPPSSLPQPCFCFSIPFHLFVYVHLVTLPVLSSRLLPFQLFRELGTTTSRVASQTYTTLLPYPLLSE